MLQVTIYFTVPRHHPKSTLLNSPNYLSKRPKYSNDLIVPPCLSVNLSFKQIFKLINTFKQTSFYPHTFWTPIISILYSDWHASTSMYERESLHGWFISLLTCSANDRTSFFLWMNIIFSSYIHLLTNCCQC